MDLFILLKSRSFFTSLSAWKLSIGMKYVLILLGKSDKSVMILFGLHMRV